MEAHSTLFLRLTQPFLVYLVYLSLVARLSPPILSNDRVDVIAWAFWKLKQAY